MNKEGQLVGSYMAYVVTCPKHGKHTHTIQSTIQGHKGVWCQICWLETLGPPLESALERVPFSNEVVYKAEGEKQ